MVRQRLALGDVTGGPQNDYYDREKRQWVIHPYNDYELYASLGMGHLYKEYQAMERSFAKGYQDNQVKVIVNGKTNYVNSSDIDIFSSSTYAGGETYYHYEIVVGEGNAQSGGVIAIMIGLGISVILKIILVLVFMKQI